MRIGGQPRLLINQRRVFRIKRALFRCKRRLLVNKRRNLTDKRRDIRVSSAQNFPSREPIPRPWQPSRRKSPVAAVCDRQTISKMQCFGGHRPPLQVWPPAFAEISEAIESISSGLAATPLCADEHGFNNPKPVGLAYL